MVPMLRTGAATFADRWQRADDAELAPPGLRASGLPVLIAGKGPRMLELVARHADQWNSAWYGDPAKPIACARILLESIPLSRPRAVSDRPWHSPPASSSPRHPRRTIAPRT